MKCPSGGADSVIEQQNAGSSSLAVWLASEPGHPGQDQVVQVEVRALSVAGSPRMAGENAEHVEALSSANGELPPIIVHYPTMRVIDGAHRLRVAKSRGDEKIPARFFHGSEADAFVLAVKSNIAHGLPLSLVDRRAAAVRIVSSHPRWSNRMVASVTGLSAKTVAEVRRREAKNSVDGDHDGDARVGQDGRVRPINGAQGRILASQLMMDNPGLSLRQAARAAGISPETARDVRNRLRLGEDPVPNQFKKKKAGDGSGINTGQERLSRGAAHNGDRSVSVVKAVERLKADPALRFTETGRILLRLLNAHLIEAKEWQKIGEHVPLHCSSMVADLARECAGMWQELAGQLERKAFDIA
jgi:ParB/Sulfiredoxin domain